MPRLTLESFSTIQIGGTNFSSYPMFQEIYIGPATDPTKHYAFGLICGGAGETWSDGSSVGGGTQHTWFHVGADGPNSPLHRSLVIDGRLYIRDDLGGGYITARQNEVEFHYESTGAKIGSCTFTTLGYRDEPYSGGLIVSATGVRQGSGGGVGYGYNWRSFPTYARTLQTRRAGGCSLSLVNLRRTTITYTGVRVLTDVLMSGVVEMISNSPLGGAYYSVALL